jgi:hypothetical protein
MRDVERRDRERLVQAPDLEAHLLAEVRVQVAERLVQEQGAGARAEQPALPDMTL